MTEDAELLRRYAQDRDEAAFGRLVERHIGFVYAAALRQLGGATHRAQDVTQSVFIDLARRARALSGRAEIAGWLYTSTHYAAAKLKRGEQRRQVREQEAQTMQELTTETTSVDWERLRPVLDEAMLALSERDREALLMRFFQGRTLREVGGRIGLSEDAARMRVARALEALRAWLTRRGVASTSAALAVALESGAMMAAPAGLATTVTGAVAAATAGGGIVASFSMATFTLVGAGALAVASGVGLVLQAQANADVQREIAALQGAVMEVATLRRENAKLARATQEAEALRSASDRLVALRGEAAALRRSTARTSAGASDPRLSRPRSTGGEVVTLTLPDADFETAFSAYEIYAGKKIVRDPSIAGLRGVIDVRTGLIMKEEALALLRAAFREKANIVIETRPDGALVAKRGPAR